MPALGVSGGPPVERTVASGLLSSLLEDYPRADGRGRRWPAISRPARRLPGVAYRQLALWPKRGRSRLRRPVTSWLALPRPPTQSTIIALLIATIKATLVVLFFMHVKGASEKLTAAVVVSGFSVATINVSVDYSANPDAVTKLLQAIAMDVRNSAAFKDIFLADPQVLGLDSMKGSQIVFPVLFKTRATQQYGPMREFQRRVRLALEEHHLLPGDPNRVFSSFLSEAHSSEDRQAQTGSAGLTGHSQPETPPTHDPTTLKPADSNPFSGE